MKFLVKNLLLFIMILSLNVNAILDVRVLKGDENAYPITIMPFYIKTNKQPKFQINKIVAADLTRSGQFRQINSNQKSVKSTDDINFEELMKNGVEIVGIGKIEDNNKKTYKVTFRLIEVYNQQQLLGKSWTVNKKSLRKMSHKISNEVYLELLGDKGDFDTHLSYITVKKGRFGRNVYYLEISDSDAQNPIIIHKSKNPILSPAWSPDGKKLAYVSFDEGYSEVYIKYIFGKHPIDKLPKFNGIASSPAWSPDGKKIVLTLSKDGNKDIYLYNIQSKKITRLTSNPAIDTEASFSPDSRYIIFSSDRGNGLQIYRLDINNKKIKRITYTGNYNANAMYAPSGKVIVLVHREYGKYRIALLDMVTGEIEVISNGNLDESPHFSSNGSMIIYSSKDGNKSFLSVLSTTGFNSHQLISSQGEVREPSWSIF